MLKIMMTEILDYFTDKTKGCFSGHFIWWDNRDRKLFLYALTGHLPPALWIGWSFATVFIRCKIWSFVTIEHKMNFTDKPDLGRHALKETDQIPCDLKVIPLAFSFPTYNTNSSFTSSPAQDSFSKLPLCSSSYSLFWHVFNSLLISIPVFFSKKNSSHHLLSCLDDKSFSYITKFSYKISLKMSGVASFCVASEQRPRHKATWTI